MKKRDFTSAFENDNSISTGISLDDAVHGLAPKLDTGRIVARPISIFEIYPDPMQPRRAIPSSVRQGWDGNPGDVPAILDRWMNAATKESNGQFNLGAYLHGEGVPDEQRKIGPIELALLKLLDVARSIYQDDLTNPITVVPFDAAYRLETGERRWLAYHLLRAEFPHEEKWAKIPARVVDAPNLWRQAAENNARDNLNAIGKARQLALLVMDLWRHDEEKPIEFLPFDAFENEREFYAQVADMSPPKGKGEILLSAMGVEHRNATMRYRNLLKLPDEVWVLADDRSWTEGRLRGLTAQSPDKAIAKARAWSREEDGLSPTGDKKAEERQDIWDKKLSHIERQLRPDSIKEIDREEKEFLRNRLATHRAWLDEIERFLR